MIAWQTDRPLNTIESTSLPHYCNQFVYGTFTTLRRGRAIQRTEKELSRPGSHYTYRHGAEAKHMSVSYRLSRKCGDSLIRMKIEWDDYSIVPMSQLVLDRSVPLFQPIYRVVPVGNINANLMTSQHLTS